jgi:hypothetical protein
MEAYNIIRIIVVLISGLSIYLGYRLFYLVTERQGKLKIKDKDTSITLGDVGPGIFFALFGTIVLVFVLSTQPYVETITTMRNNLENTNNTEAVDVTIKSTRAPASSEQTENEFALFCFEDPYQASFNEGVDILESLKWFLKNEPFKNVEKAEKENLLSFLNKLQAPPAFTSLAKLIVTYSDYYYFLKSFLLFYYSTYHC